MEPGARTLNPYFLHVHSTPMTPTQLNALIAYIDARFEQAESKGYEYAPAREHALFKLRELREAFAPEPEYRPFNEPLRDPYDPCP